MTDFKHDQNNDYIARQSIADRKYLREYKRWIDSLSPREREKLSKLGLEKPKLSRHSAGFPDCRADSMREFGDDIGDSSITGRTAIDDRSHDEKVWDVLRRFICEVLDSSNPKLTIECMAIVSGFSSILGGETFSEVGKRHGIGRAAVSKRCVLLCERLGLAPSFAMKSIGARAAYRAAQLARNRRERRVERSRQPNYLSAINRLAQWWQQRRAECWTSAELDAAARDLGALFKLADNIRIEMNSMRGKLK